jgi:hypothetical protein
MKRVEKEAQTRDANVCTVCEIQKYNLKFLLPSAATLIKTEFSAPGSMLVHTPKSAYLVQKYHFFLLGCLTKH